jgi:DNA-binding MarR family transcriptional regulator
MSDGPSIRDHRICSPRDEANDDSEQRDAKGLSELMTGKAKRRKTAPSAHQELVVRVGVAVRRMGAQSVIISRTIADRFDLNVTDLEVLDLIFLREQATAGDLAVATGLTSGAVTALIDRLVKAGYVERRADPADRRTVLVRINHAAIEPIKAVYDVTQRRMFTLWSTFGPRDLAVIAEFLTQSTELAVERCQEIRQSRATAKSATDFWATRRARRSVREGVKTS